MEKSVNEEVADVSMSRPHVVLLGAGASRAAVPSGDRNGKLLPLMNDFFDIPEFAENISATGIPYKDKNFEELYSNLANDTSKEETRINIEKVIYNYFSSLQLTDEPTIYDYLILSLRPKDVIATFNWDPFLIQSAIRNGRIGGIPKLLFLHGNVLSGFCEKDMVHGVNGAICSRCGSPLAPTRLLFPTTNKDYISSPAIQNAWDAVKLAFKNAFMVTIFGYSAPVSDIGAIELLKNAWGGVNERNMEQFEIIDIRNDEELLNDWSPFIHTHHYEVHPLFFDSWIANHPRRSGEAYFSQYFDAKFIENNPLPQFLTLKDLWSWFTPILKAEKRQQA